MPELPPKPDPDTGEPRPPRAPVPARHEATRTNRTRRKPEPPDGRGPTLVLAHYREQARYPLLHALKAATTFAVLLLLISSGFTVTEWFVLPVAGLHFVGYLLFFGQRELVSCGAEWVQHNHHWIRGTYEISRVDYAYDSRGEQPRLVLDKHVHRLNIPVDILYSNQELWDYVHLALRHSVANRAELTAAAREQFPELAAVEPPRLPLARNTSTDDEHSPNSSEPANHHRGESILAMRDSVLGHLRFHDKKHRS